MSLAERPARRAASLAAWTKLRPSGTPAIRLVWLRKIVRALMGDRGLGTQGLPLPPLYGVGRPSLPSQTVAASFYTRRGRVGHKPGAPATGRPRAGAWC